MGGGFHSNKHIGRKQKGKMLINKQVQNRQFKDVVRTLKLNVNQARRLHDFVSDGGYSYQELLQIARDMFDK